MKTALPLTRQLVLIGGGHTHALVLRMWGMNPLPGVQVTVINPGPTAPYTGMLPGFVAGHYTRDELDIDLVRLARFAGARLIDGKASAIDREARRITVGDRHIPYDICAIDIGITSDMPKLPGFTAHGVPAKPLGRLAVEWAEWLDTGTGPAAVIGGGVAGVELSLAMAHAMQTQGNSAGVTVIEADRALRAVGHRARATLKARLQALGVTLLENTRPTEVTPEGVKVDNGQLLPATFVVGAAGARPHGWLADLGLDQTEGYLDVGPTLQTSDPAIFGTGDCVTLTHAPRPKAGVFAVRAAPVLFQNLRASLMGRSLKRFNPQRDYLKLISLGGQEALAEKWGLTIAGGPLWRLKDRIDRAFMAKFMDYPDMASALPKDRAQGVDEALGGKPLCGGCGSKVALPALGLTGPPEDAAEIGGLVMSTDHLRAFTNDPGLMAKIVTNHALGDIWAMGAQPGAALVNLTLPSMDSRLQALWVEEIMGAIRAALGAAGGTVAGGHTAMGAELTIGLTVTGERPPRPVTLAGAQPGDHLILTKPLGTGIILAAEMQSKARGADVLAAYASMERPQGAAAAVLSGLATAMTDVTGFGLAGHLTNLTRASNVGAEIMLDDLPILPGAAELAAGGIASALASENRAAAGIREVGHPREDLLFDPQTAGGLLAAIPAAGGTRVLEELKQTLPQSRKIGVITPNGGVTLR